MKALAVRRDGATVPDLEGRVACYDVRDGDGKIAVRKGQTLDGGAAALALSLPWEEIHLLELEPGDLHEEPAGARLSRAAAGPGVEAQGYSGGQWTLAATRRGLLRVREWALAEVNAQDGISVFTLYDLQPVEAGETVARCKVTPLAIAEPLIEQVEERARASEGLLAVAPFRPTVVGALTRENLEGKQRARFEATLKEKVDWFGSRLLPIRYCASQAGSVASTLEALATEGAQMLIAAGASSLDPLDPIFLGLTASGGRMERHGAPAHPGSLLWLARLGDRPVLGMPACGMFSQATTFDLLLPRLLTGERIGNAEIAALGHGGLLSRDSAYRFPAYRKSVARGELPE
jgi:hypothetical protein